MAKEYINLSNGESDGLAIFCVKEGTLYTVALTEEQADMLDVTISMAMQGKVVIDEKRPICKVQNLMMKE